MFVIHAKKEACCAKDGIVVFIDNELSKPLDHMHTYNCNIVNRIVVCSGDSS